MLPKMSGFEVCREIRKLSAVLIVMLTTRDQVDDRVKGLELGKDDYLPKPYEPRELALDLAQMSGWLGKDRLDLTAADFSVLRLLAENAGKNLTREEIFLQIRRGTWDSVDRTVDVVVSRLRQKLKDDSKQSRYLKTMWGDGYRFVGNVTHAWN